MSAIAVTAKQIVDELDASVERLRVRLKDAELPSVEHVQAIYEIGNLKSRISELEQVIRVAVEALEELIACAPHDGEGARRSAACMNGRESLTTLKALIRDSRITEQSLTLQHKEEE